MSKTATIKSEPLTLDERIATALASPPASSSDLFELVIETTAALEFEDESGYTARKQSLDASRLDGDALRAKADDHAFRAHRLRNGLAGLQALYDEAIAREQAAAWHEQFEKARAVRDQLASEFASRYQSIVTELVGLFGRIAKCDQDIDSIHATSPDGEGMRLRKVEAAARGIDLVDGSDSVIEKCKLPSFATGHQYNSPLAWPPKVPSAIMQIMGFSNGMPNEEDDQYYETVLDESTGFYIAKRRADAPPLPNMGPAPVPISLREQALAEQASRAEERDRQAREGQEAQRVREFG